MGYIGDLAVVIVMAVMAVGWIYVIMTWMAEGEISGKMGFATIFASMLLLAVGASSPVDAVKYSVALLFLCAPFTLPTYNVIAGKASNRELDLQYFERAHDAFAANPANIGSRFEIAKHLARLGQYGHAIAIAKGAESMLTDDQGVHQRGTRGMFYKELADLKHWQTVAKQEDFRNVKCPRCARPNPPGTIACLSCNSPFLLDIVRQGTKTGHVGTKIALVWLCFTAIVAIAAILGSYNGGWLVIFPIMLMVIAAAGLINWLMNDRIKFA
jgi:hypothetical protein